MSIATRASAICLCFLLLTLGCAQTATVEHTLLIANITIVDPVDGTSEPRNVWIDGDTIVAITDPDAGDHTAATSVDGFDHFLIPGLWDAHVHLTYAEDIGHEVFFPLSLAHGITSLRDTGGQLDLLAPALAAVQAGQTPSLYVSGPLIDGSPVIYDGSSRFLPALGTSVTTPPQARELVASLDAAGVDMIKAYELLRPEVFAAVVDEATARGLPVSAHVPLRMSAAQAARSGVSDMMHLRNLYFDCAAPADDLLMRRRAMLDAATEPRGSQRRSALQNAFSPEALASQDQARCEALVSILAEERVAQTPTLGINSFMTERLFDLPRWQRGFADLPGGVRERWLNDIAGLSTQSPSERQSALSAWSFEMVGQLAAAGVPIMAGTDAPIALLNPGISLHEELALLVRAGLTNQQALAAATIEPARFFSIDDELGRVAPGYRADLVLLSANPLIDIRNSTAIVSVVKDGVVHDAEALRALKGQSASSAD